MITVLRVVIGSGCLAIGAVLLAVALRQFRREMTWRRVAAVVRQEPGQREGVVVYTDADGIERVGQHWGISAVHSGGLRPGQRVILLHDPRQPGRLATPVGVAVVTLLAAAGIGVGLLGLWMMVNGFMQ